MTLINKNHSKNHCLGVVLAGGLSTRMGEDKAQLLRNDIKMIDYATQLLTDVGIDKVISSGNKHQVADIVENAGPVGGIYSVIKQYQPNAMLILPVDLPLMTSAALSKLKHAGELSAKACFFQGHNIPLYLPINGFVELFLQQAFQQTASFEKTGKGPSIRSLLKQVPHQSITVENQQFLFNSNTQQQWQQAKQIFSNPAMSKQSTQPLRSL